MKNRWNFLNVVAVMMCLVLTSGCAGMSAKQKGFAKGFAAGAAVGGGTGAIVTHDEDEDDRWKGAGIGALAGGLIGGVIGMYTFTEEAAKPEPAPAAAPAPKAESKPAPAPEPKKAEPVVKEKVILRGINFDFNKADVKKEFVPVLDEAAKILNQRSDVKVVVAGHTDSVGTDKYNQKLSERRADSVYKFLVNKGIDAKRLSKVGYGETRPIADNKTEEGRKVNRRVEFSVME